MPITDINSYIGTTSEFATNWMAANAELGANGPITLAGNYTLAQFNSDRTVLSARIDATRAAQDDERDAYDLMQTLKLAIKARGKQFRGAVMSKITDRDLIRELPTLPNVSEKAPDFVMPLKAMAREWLRINQNAAKHGLSGPLTLAGGYDIAAFNTDIAGVMGQFETAQSRAELAVIARNAREVVMGAIYERMKQYRQAAPSYLSKDSPVLAALPRLTPAPGTTPPPVVVKARWDDELKKAVLDVSAIPQEIIDKYGINKLQLRGCTGDDYKNDHESLIANFAVGTLRIETDWALTVDGSEACYKLYVMCDTGNENGGKAVVVVRPEPED